MRARMLRWRTVCLGAAAVTALLVPASAGAATAGPLHSYTKPVLTPLSDTVALMSQATPGLAAAVDIADPLPASSSSLVVRRVVYASLTQVAVADLLAQPGGQATLTVLEGGLPAAGAAPTLRTVYQHTGAADGGTGCDIGCEVIAEGANATAGVGPEACSTVYGCLGWLAIEGMEVYICHSACTETVVTAHCTDSNTTMGSYDDPTYGWANMSYDNWVDCDQTMNEIDGYTHIINATTGQRDTSDNGYDSSCYDAAPGSDQGHSCYFYNEFWYGPQAGDCYYSTLFYAAWYTDPVTGNQSAPSGSTQSFNETCWS